MKLNILIIASFFISLNTYSMPLEIQEEIAQEMYDEGEYRKALNKCLKITRSHKSTICNSIIAKSKTILSERKKKKELVAKAKKEKENQLLAEKKRLKEESMAKQKAEHQKLINSFDYNNLKVCECNAGEDYYVRKISQEKSNISGIVNKRKLHLWGQQHMHVVRAKGYYISMLKKNNFKFNNSSCKNSKSDANSYHRCIKDTPSEHVY